MWFGIAALIVSIAAVLIALKAERRAERAERREERANGRDERHAQRELMGQPIITPGPISGGAAAPRVEHAYTVANGGAASITSLWLWIEGANGRVVSTRAGGPKVTITPGGSPVHLGVEAGQPLPEGELTLWVGWVDTAGEHRESTGIHPPPHA